MTFRIDSLEKRKTYWSVSIKGVDGAGVYGRLRTSNSGRGLTLSNAPEHSERVLFNESAFYIPEIATKDEAVLILSEALTNLGWGPEVDNGHRILKRKI
jgi:hypothetical protein